MTLKIKALILFFVSLFFITILSVAISNYYLKKSFKLMENKSVEKSLQISMKYIRKAYINNKTTEIQKDALKIQNALSMITEFNVFRIEIINKLKISFLILTVTSFIISLLFSVILNNQIYKPVNILLENIKRIENGNYDIKIKNNGPKDIKNIANVFNSMAEKLKQYIETEKIQAKYESWKDLAGFLVHEIKNKLTPAKLSLEEFVTEFDNEIKNKIKPVFNTMLSIEEIVKDLKQLSNFPAPDYQKIYPDQIILEEIKFYKNTDIKFECRLDENAEIFMNKTYFIVIITNLIKNAFEAIDKKNGVIKICSKQDNGKVEISIKDNGRGINRENIAGIFKNKTSYKGSTGLGLYFVKKICKDYKVKILVDSIIDKGTEFKLVFNKTKEFYSENTRY